jgi:hypothetical protein
VRDELYRIRLTQFMPGDLADSKPHRGLRPLWWYWRSRENGETEISNKRGGAVFDHGFDPTDATV